MGKRPRWLCHVNRNELFLWAPGVILHLLSRCLGRDRATTFEFTCLLSKHRGYAVASLCFDNVFRFEKNVFEGSFEGDRTTAFFFPPFESRPFVTTSKNILMDKVKKDPRSASPFKVTLCVLKWKSILCISGGHIQPYKMSSGPDQYVITYK